MRCGRYWIHDQHAFSPHCGTQGTNYPLTLVEVTVSELDDEVEQQLDNRLELIDSVTGEPTTTSISTSVLGVRLRYCLQFNPDDESLEHWVEYTKSGARVPKNERDLLQAIIITHKAPLQLRAEGAFRSLMINQDEHRLNTTLTAFTDDVHAASDQLASSDAVTSALTAMSGRGAFWALGIDKQTFESGVGFAAEDGSIAGLLRSIQATLDIDGAGPLPISAHGSTAATILSITEAIATSPTGRVLIVDDFGDSLDSASADFLAKMIRRGAKQVWMATRRSEAYGGFEPEELTRLSLRSGSPSLHQLSPNPSRQERVRRRYLTQLLASAMSARMVILTKVPTTQRVMERWMTDS
jgi:putative ATP-dependent endonuclease of OLD family